MAYDISSPITGTKLATMAPDAVRSLWQSGIDLFEQNNDFFAPMEGGPNSLIFEKTDLSKGRGQKITFTVGSGFHDEPHIGEQLFESSDDYEEFLLKTHDLVVDWVRHGVRVSERTEDLMGMRNEIQTGFNTQQGAWAGRLKSEQLFMMFRESLPSDNVLYAGGKTIDTLKSADTLDWDEIISLGAILKTKGGEPAQVGALKNGQPVFRNTVIATSDALFSLDMDPTYKQILRDTKVEQYAKLLFEGGYSAPKGHIIAEYTPIDHDGEGAIGSPLNPQARLGNAIVPGTAPVAITGGGNPTSAAKTKKKYFKYFENYAYKFIGNFDATSDGSTLAAVDASTHYLLVINPANAATDPGKVGMYAYTTGNNGNQITITKRLGAAAAGDRVTTLGTVTWDAGVWTGKHTDTHPVGALVVQCNAAGVPVGHSFMLGKRAAYRGYGKHRNKRVQDDKEGGFLMERYIVSVFGQSLRKDRLGRVPSAVRLTHAISIPGVILPTVS
jgi:hypothetical protein